jgi:hypothetical protein
MVSTVASFTAFGLLHENECGRTALGYSTKKCGHVHDKINLHGRNRILRLNLASVVLYPEI